VCVQSSESATVILVFSTGDADSGVIERNLFASTFKVKLRELVTI